MEGEGRRLMFIENKKKLVEEEDIGGRVVSYLLANRDRLLRRTQLVFT